MEHKEITRSIIGAAMAVLNELKPGLEERLYENALVLELTTRGHTVQQQLQYAVHYRSQLVGTLIPDLIIDGKVLADAKVVSALTQTHLAQMLGYLTVTRLDVALLLNFKESTLAWRRVVRGGVATVRPPGAAGAAATLLPAASALSSMAEMSPAQQLPN